VAEKSTIKTMHRRSNALAVLGAAAAIGLAACGGGSSSRHVADLGKSSNTAGGGSTTTLPRGNPTQLLDEWAACMRSHGDPGQADPTIDANKDIDVNIPPSVEGGVEGYSGEYGAGGPGLYCRAYMTAAQSGLGGNPDRHVDEAKLLKYSECMRANGIPDFPDPTSTGLSIRFGSDLNPNNPEFQNASKLCRQKVPGALSSVSSTPPPGIIKLDGAGPP
jgi:hypothetical protein